MAFIGSPVHMEYYKPYNSNSFVFFTSKHDLKFKWQFRNCDNLNVDHYNGDIDTI